jgi:dihydrofolate reductase
MISLLVAYTKDKRVIGAQGKIPWNLSSERNRFKEICRGKYVIMGRKSFEEIGKPLSYCKLMVLSKSNRGPSTGSGTTSCSGTTGTLQFVHSLKEAFDYCKEQGQEEILVAGGGEIYRQALPYATKIYATEIDAHFEGDTFFPELDNSWNCTVESTHEENGIVYRYMTFTLQTADLQ